MTKPFLVVRSNKQSLLSSITMDTAIKHSSSAAPIPSVTMTENLYNIHAMMSLIFWYLFSFLTLFMNKYTLDALRAEPYLFSTVQIVVSTIFGGINMRHPCYMGRASFECSRRSLNFYISMGFVGITRFLVVFLSLVSLQYVAVSFTETVKSSAPLFTVVISWLILREKNGLYVQLSLLPIMTGLMLCSAYELSFTMIGFLAALGTNLAECLQFVLSKLSLSSLANKTTPAEFQFYSCFASTILQLPVCLLFMDYKLAGETTMLSFIWMILNGIAYHIQTMTAWVLMEYLSPVTHSVCNTVKRAIAIWLSVLVFGNEVTLLSGIGTAVVIAGVFLYNRARHYEQHPHHHSLSKTTGRSTFLSDNGLKQIVTL